MASLETLTGIVDVIGTKGGFSLRERTGYLHISQFADPRPEIPEPGQRVEVGLDAKQFVRTIAVLDPAPPASASPSSSPAAAGPSRETIITRLAVLKSASHIAAARPTMDRAAMLDLASDMERWVNRA